MHKLASLVTVWGTGEKAPPIILVKSSKHHSLTPCMTEPPERAATDRMPEVFQQLTNCAACTPIKPSQQSP